MADKYGGMTAARLLGPAAHEALSRCLDAVRSVTGEDGRTLVPEFEALCYAAIRRALGLLDAAAGGRFGKSPIVRRIQADLQENLYSEMGDVYEAQVASLREATFASFRGKLNKLRIGPGVVFFLFLLAAAEGGGRRGGGCCGGWRVRGGRVGGGRCGGG